MKLRMSENTWLPPAIDTEALVREVMLSKNARYVNEFLHVFRTEPYIDSIYIEFNSRGFKKQIRRFTFHENYLWAAEDEMFFHKHCVKSTECSYFGNVLDNVYRIYEREHPEWHLQRYYTKGLRLLDHIYHCLKQDTAKEMLYKSGLDELAVHLDEMDELNLLAKKPSDLFGGLSMKVLRSINCPEGKLLIKTKKWRDFIKDLNMKFPDVFKKSLNDAQCRYLNFLIVGELTVGEAGRLFESRRPALEGIWCKPQFDLFLLDERNERETQKLCAFFEAIDPIYGNYIRKVKNVFADQKIKLLRYYLFYKRREYDLLIRRANRRRNEDWQERGEKYLVRYPQTINDFCREAIYMQNCLLTYAEAMIHNDTTILFMRKSDDVNQPFITIEVYGNKLMQAYHRFNEDCTSDEADWIRDYCKRHGIITSLFHFNAEIDELY